jgi:hypothetical protein
MHRPAGADDCGVAAALAPIVLELHRQAGERINGRRGNGDRVSVTLPYVTESLRGIIGALGRRLVGKQIKLSQLVFRGMLI